MIANSNEQSTTTDCNRNSNIQQPSLHKIDCSSSSINHHPFLINNFNNRLPLSSAAASVASTTSSYRSVIIDIYQSLYDFQRHRNDDQEIRLINCINKWYDPSAVFENPFTRAAGSQAIIDQFSLMSLIPGKIWSELGDVCESDDYDGNRVIIFTHTLHFELLQNRNHQSNDISQQQAPSIRSQLDNASLPQTPYLSSIQSQLNLLTPTITNYFNQSHHHNHQSNVTTSSTYNYNQQQQHHRFRVRQAGSQTEWPISWLISRLNPIEILKNLTNLDLKLLTKLHLNEQSRIVYHEDVWGLKQVLEFLIPSFVNQAFGIQRSLVGFVGNFVAQRLIQSNRPITHSQPQGQQAHGSQQPSQQQQQQGLLSKRNYSIDGQCGSMSKPIAIGNLSSQISRTIQDYQDQTFSLKPSSLSDDDDDDEVLNGKRLLKALTCKEPLDQSIHSRSKSNKTKSKGMFQVNSGSGRTRSASTSSSTSTDTYDYKIKSLRKRKDDDSEPKVFGSRKRIGNGNSNKKKNRRNSNTGNGKKNLTDDEENDDDDNK